MHALKKVVNHFGKKTNPAVVMPVYDTEEGKTIPSMVMLPLKWVAEMMEKHPYPKNSWNPFSRKRWDGQMRKIN